MQYVIIGGGIAGVTAAKTIREMDPKGDISVYSNEFHPLGLYARKDLARRLAQPIDAPEAFLIESQESLARLGIHFHYHDILRVFPQQKQILKSHTIRNRYDRLLLALGATPKLIDAPGLHYYGVHQVRNYDDLSIVEAWLPELRQYGAVIIGGGILGLDLAYGLRRRDVPVTLVVREKHLGLPLLSENAALLVDRKVRQDGINLILGRTLAAYLSRDEKLLDGVRLDDGATIDARMALCAVGVAPNTGLVQDIGLEMDEATGAIIVNERMETSIEGIYAAGNCALVNGQVARTWQMSGEQGYIAGRNLAGHHAEYKPLYAGDMETQIYNLPLAYFGHRGGSETTTTWATGDGETRYTEIVLDQGRIVGATFLGSAVDAAPFVLERFIDQTAITVEDLKYVVAG